MAPLRDYLAHREDIDTYLQEQAAAFETLERDAAPKQAAHGTAYRGTQAPTTDSTPMTLRFQADVNLNELILRAVSRPGACPGFPHRGRCESGRPS